MFLKPYYTELEAGRFSFTRQQSSDFAKLISNDFNPLHDVETKRFCVPGDLLFAKILTSKGLFSKMKVSFSGMVTDGVELDSVVDSAERLTINDSKGKEYLAIEHNDQVTHDLALIEQLVRSYVSFSGENFPHVLVPLMHEQNVMINPARPLIIYESMSVELDTLDLVKPVLKATTSELKIDGKRGRVTLNFAFEDEGKVVGKGSKSMALANLREYDDAVMTALVGDYNKAKDNFTG
ncbi:hypothetical protein SIN8267_00159 [Sinobacterium norvegicum]|uniref:DUF3581 domain-containing protein n=1 Tax=Sinobacterium norvegicum TaxID=1641715 RepID=A0ABM9AA04_9GAMM|nr:DUF3581 family protein [Sinobacterium norvegicum]CAH0990076.1 hypothetical protein SIN8267_00159 [Sinobacterium norvegicum]